MCFMTQVVLIFDNKLKWVTLFNINLGAGNLADYLTSDHHFFFAIILAHVSFHVSIYFKTSTERGYLISKCTRTAQACLSVQFSLNYDFRLG